MLSNLQLLSFEIGRTCNLAALHPWCPVNDSSRHSVNGCNGLQMPLNDAEIIYFAKFAQLRGFKGLVAWHYYNEPMIHMERILSIGRQLQEVGLRMGLWTNGTLIREDDLGWIDRFEIVWITDHDPERREIYRRLATKFPGKILMRSGNHDDRISVYSKPEKGCSPCWRPTILEMIVDYVGDLHLCCADWRGECQIGNVRRDNAAELIDRWGRMAVAASVGALPICEKCQSLEKSPSMADKEFLL